MRTFFILLTVSMITFLVSCKEKEAPKKETSAQVVKTETSTPVKDAKIEKQEPVVKEKTHYFLIAGCFEYKNNADKLCQKLQNEGFKEAVVLDYYENLYLVSYEGYAKKSDALTALKNIQQDANKKNTWLYHVK